MASMVGLCSFIIICCCLNNSSWTINQYSKLSDYSPVILVESLFGCKEVVVFDEVYTVQLSSSLPIPFRWLWEGGLGDYSLTTWPETEYGDILLLPQYQVDFLQEKRNFLPLAVSMWCFSPYSTIFIVVWESYVFFLDFFVQFHDHSGMVITKQNIS